MPSGTEPKAVHVCPQVDGGSHHVVKDIVAHDQKMKSLLKTLFARPDQHIKELHLGLG